MDFEAALEAVRDLIPPKIAAAAAAYLPLSNEGFRYAEPGHLIDWSQRSLYISAASIVFNPLYWNILARKEYNSKVLSRGLGLGRYGATYFFTLTIFSLGIIRDILYERAIRDQPHYAPLAHPGVKAAGVALFLLGQLFVVTSIYQLGIVGTYLGDYCGILMKERVTAFPFNVLEDPMYVGSAMAFLGTALFTESIAGVLLTALVWNVYSIALKFEGPFTAKIYSSAAAKKDEEDKAAKAVKAAEAKTNADIKKVEAKPAAVPAAPTSVPSTATSTATATAPATPRKSNRLAEKPADVEGTPRRRSRKSQVVTEATGAPEASSPMRVTRSKSRALGSGGESD